MLETDFENEAANSERMASLVASEPRLRDRVYIPKVYHDLTTRVSYPTTGYSYLCTDRVRIAGHDRRVDRGRASLGQGEPDSSLERPIGNG